MNSFLAKSCCTAIMLICSVSSHAQEFKYDNITYYVNSEEAPSGINEMHQEIAGQPVAIYSLNGTRLRSNARGIMLKRMPDGTVRKTIR